MNKTEPQPLRLLIISGVICGVLAPENYRAALTGKAKAALDRKPRPRTKVKK